MKLKRIDKGHYETLDGKFRIYYRYPSRFASPCWIVDTIQYDEKYTMRYFKTLSECRIYLSSI